MGHPIVTTINLTAGVSNGIAPSQSLAGPGALGLSGTYVTAGVAGPFNPSRRVVIFSTGNDSGITWTISGTARDHQGNVPQTETIPGSNGGGAPSTQDFKTVTNIVGSGATAGPVTAGTNNTASGPWVPWSQFQTDFQVSCVGFVISGTPIWQVDYTYDDVFGLWLPASVPFPRALTHPVLVNEAGTADGGFTSPIRASRLTLTAAGQAQLTQIQQGI